ncbi:MAG: hypothetical protein MJY48_05820, partial [Bacteroidales bacterium]|nr:hypothetical protein [Bacteroidales bacterium]
MVYNCPFDALRAIFRQIIALSKENSIKKQKNGLSLLSMGDLSNFPAKFCPNVGLPKTAHQQNPVFSIQSHHLRFA